jgi:4'-phosphopantetheinyl transferase EntD
MSLSDLFDSSVVLGFGVPTELAPRSELYPEERLSIQRAVEKRRNEYAATRLLARQAFAALGAGAFALPNREDRSPVWPEGLVGSLTHTDGFCAVAVARDSTHRALGIDAEVAERVGSELFSRVLTPRELEFVNSFVPERQQGVATLLFSAKESFYKCQHPLTKRFLGFQDVELDVELDAGRFSVRVLVDEPRLHDSAEWAGRFVWHGHVVVTAVCCNVPVLPYLESTSSERRPW